MIAETVLLAGGLSLLMGGVLGLLGGGGSILTLPILIYALGLGTKEAIATSLLVVGVTSAVAMTQHARRGNVAWRVGLIFGAVAMIGAFAGGRLAAYVSGEALLYGFIALMAVAAVMMLRGKKQTPASMDVDGADSADAIGEARWSVVAIEGLIVGLVTGMVGAGGGFMVVPALVLFGGMGMRRAIGTSLLVITLKAFAGLAGHLGHVSIDLEIAGVVTGAAVVGAFVGSWLATRICPKRLRQVFAWFVLIMAVYMFAQSASSAFIDAVFVHRWPFWAGGLAIGAFVLLMVIIGRKRLGVSTGFEDVCGVVGVAATRQQARRSWRLPFMGGIVLGGVIAAVAGGGLAATMDMGAFDALWGLGPVAKGAFFVGGGVLVGFGARLAGGCTSGHGIVGMAQLAPASLIATGCFMVAGFGTTALVMGALA